MKIYTLVGKSGTGKSFHAIKLAKDYGIEGIIDDGLFIYKNQVIAGLSAKKATTKVGAVKIAVFMNDEAREDVRCAVLEKKPESLLILATSDEMANIIIEKLGLVPEGDIHRIYIEDITTEEEREIARVQRDSFGKHVIPAPALQLKESFSGYFMNPLRIFFGKEKGMAQERTVVRPTFSYMGDYTITDKVISDIVEIVASKVRGVSKVVYIGQAPSPESYKIMVYIMLDKGFGIWETSSVLQTKLRDALERMTAFNVSEVDIEVRGIV